MEIIITSPSLDPQKNVSGISSVTKFIIENNVYYNYIHFELGKRDNEKGGIFRIFPIMKNFFSWNILLSRFPNAIVHYNFPLSKASIIRDPLFIWLARMRKHKIVIHIHGGIFLTSSHIPVYLNYILKKIFSLPISFIVLSEKEKEILVNKFDCKKVFILPNCINLNEAIFFHRTANYENPLTIGYLGRIAETKGMDYLLDACIRLKEMGIKFLLKLAGKEEIINQYLPKFKEKLGEQFIYCGIVSGKTKLEFLKSLDAFVLPSFFEGLPMSLIECMSFGVVPVVTNVGSISEIIRDGYNGLFIEVKDSNTITHQIIKLNADRSLLQYFSRNAKDFIVQNFNVKKYVNALNNIYAFINT